MTGRSDLDLDFATLTSVTGYGLTDFRTIDDANATFQGLAQLATGRSDVGAISYFSVNSRKFSQELRLVSPSDRPLEWLIGAFYTNEKNKPFYNLVASDLVTGEVGRSEEHTSELPSLMRISYAVFCLKKKRHIT